MIKKRIILLSVTSMLILYTIFSSLIYVKPGYVVIINEIKLGTDRVKLISRALINEGEKAKIFTKQPVIPGTGIGYIEEVYDSSKPYNFKTSFTLYTLDQLTGNNEDKNKVRAYTISGTIGEINDWEVFLNKLNVEEVNSNRSPYFRKYNSRVEILADQLKFLLRTSTPEQYYPYGAGTEESVMNLGQKINYLKQELVSRRNFLVSLKDRYNFPNEDYYRQYLISNTPWYWVLGIDRFENLINQSKKLREYEQSIYSEQISRRGNAEKYIANEDYLNLLNMMGKINYYEQNLVLNEQNLIDLEKYISQLPRGMSPEEISMGAAISRDFQTYLKSGNSRLIDLTQEGITESLSRYIDEDLYTKLISAINYRKLILNIEYLDVYRNQVLESYDYSEEDLLIVEKTFTYLLNNYDDMLKKENWENYIGSVNTEFNKFFHENPNLAMPEDKIQILTNYKLYSYYLNNIKPSLQRHEIGENHNLYPLMKTLNNYPDLFISDKETLNKMIMGWLQNRDADFMSAAGSMISYNWQKERITGIMNNLKDFKESELDPFILYESENYDLEESERLWNAAIDSIINGKDLSEEKHYTFYNVNRDETVNSIGDLYNIDPYDIFYENRFDLRFRDTGLRNELNKKMNYENFQILFESGNNEELIENQHVYIPLEKKYTDSWAGLKESKKDLRDYYINRYVYSNLEMLVPEAFKDFISKTDYISNLEHNYGVEFAELDFYIEDRSIFSNPRTGEVDNDFIDFYYQKTLR